MEHTHQRAIPRPRNGPCKEPEDLEMLTAALKIRTSLKHSLMTFVGICELIQARNRFGLPLLHKLITKMKAGRYKSLIEFAVSTAIKGKRKCSFSVLATRAALVSAGLLKDFDKEVSKSRLVRQHMFRFVTKRGTHKRGVVDRDAAGTKCVARTVM